MIVRVVASVRHGRPLQWEYHISGDVSDAESVHAKCHRLFVCSVTEQVSGSTVSHGYIPLHTERTEEVPVLVCCLSGRSGGCSKLLDRSPPRQNRGKGLARGNPPPEDSEPSRFGLTGP